MPILDIKNINFGFNKPLFENFSLAIEAGEFVLLKGRNGSGKSTLINLICGIEKPQSGQISVAGTQVFGVDDVAGKVAVVFQNPVENFVSPLVEEEISFALQNQKFGRGAAGKRAKAARITEILNEFQIGLLRKKNPTEISGGQAALVAVAAALASRPKLLILDEPCASLDQTSAAQVLEAVINACRKDNIAVLYVSHGSETFQKFDKIVTLGNPCAEDLNAVNKQHGNKTVLTAKSLSVKGVFSSINLSVKTGDVLFITGASGSGKTTLLNAINGFTRYEGEIDIFGQPLLSFKNRIEFRRKVSFLVAAGETSFCFPTVREEVEFKLKNLSISETPETVLNRVNIQHIANNNPTTLSGGEKRLLLLAIALAGCPRLLCLDEVFAGLDAVNSALVINAINSYRNENPCAVLIVCHNSSIIENSVKNGAQAFEVQKSGQKQSATYAKSMTLGKYSGKNTIIHRVPALLKFFTVAAFITACFIFKSYYVFAGLFAFFVLCAILSKTTLVIIYKYVRWLALITISIFVLNWVTVSLNFALLMLTRLMLINLFAPLLSVTTTPYEISQAFYVLLYPLKLIKIPVEDFALAVSLTLAFLPVLQNEALKIRKMQIIKGADYGRGQIIKRAAQSLSLLVPVILFAIYSSERMALNLLIRGYGLKK